VKKYLVGKRQGKRQFGRSKHRWDANIKTHLTLLGYKLVNSFGLAQNIVHQQAFVNT